MREHFAIMRDWWSAAVRSLALYEDTSNPGQLSLDF
jgi:hypothetical protein